MNECQDNSEFFPHSKKAIDTQRDYIKLAGAIYSCQMVVVPVAICIPPGLVRVFAGVSAGLAARAAYPNDHWEGGRGHSLTQDVQ